MIIVQNFSKIFRNAIISNFTNNLSKKTSNSLAGILMLDYVHRIEKKIEVKNYLNGCVNNLKKFLGKKVILEENFSIVISLFIVAITSNTESPDSFNNLVVDQKQAVIKTIIDNYFKNLTGKTKEKVQNILEILLTQSSLQEIINYIEQDPDIIITIAEQQEIDFKVLTTAKTQNQLKKIVLLNIKNQKNISYLKNLTSSIATITSMIIVLSASLGVGSALMPLMLIPCALGVLKYSPDLGNFLGQKISDIKLAKNINLAKTELQNLKGQLISELKKLSQKLSQASSQEIISPTVDLNKLNIMQALTEAKEMGLTKEQINPQKLVKQKKSIKELGK